jgi:hypothetical protein
MKKIITLLLITVFISCNNNKFKFKITGNVKTPTGYGNAIAYTDTIHGRCNDSIWYYNTDGTKVTLRAPYRVYIIK